MKAPICPRCQGELSEPSAWHSAWQCARHGSVQPLRLAHVPSAEGLQTCSNRPPRRCGCRGPYPRAGWTPASPARVMTAAGPGVLVPVRAKSGRRPGGDAGHLRGAGPGLGAGLAGLDGPDPGEGFAAGPPHALVQFGNHEFPLWSVESPGAAVFAGRCWPTGCGSPCGPTWPAPSRRSACPWGSAGSRAGTGRPVRRALAAAALLKDLKDPAAQRRTRSGLRMAPPGLRCRATPARDAGPYDEPSCASTFTPTPPRRTAPTRPPR